MSGESERRLKRSAAAFNAAQERRERNFNRNALRRIARARRFPDNTDPFVRHVEIIAKALASGRPYPMLSEEPGHVAGSLLVTVEHLYKARNALARLLPHKDT